MKARLSFDSAPVSETKSLYEFEGFESLKKKTKKAALLPFNPDALKRIGELLSDSISPEALLSSEKIQVVIPGNDILEEYASQSCGKRAFVNSSRFKAICDSFKSQTAKFAERRYCAVYADIKMTHYNYFRGVVFGYFQWSFDELHDTNISKMKGMDEYKIKLMLFPDNEDCELPKMWDLERSYHSDKIDYSLKDRPRSCLDIVEMIFSDSKKAMLFNECIDKAIERAVQEYIEYKVFCSDCKESDILSLKCLPEQELIFVIKRVISLLSASVERAVCLWLTKHDPDKFFTARRKEEKSTKRKTSYLERKEGFNKAQEDLNKANKEIKRYEQKLAEKDEEIARLKELLDKAETETHKAEKAEINSVRTELKKEKERNSELEARIDRLNDFINLLQTEDEPEPDIQEEPHDAMQELEEIAKGFKDKKIVFVRNNKSSKYLVMKNLESFFPNAKFTNGVARDIDTGKTDIVCLLTKYVEHGTYYGARDLAKAAGVKCVHCEFSRLEGIVKTIAEALDR